VRTFKGKQGGPPKKRGVKENRKIWRNRFTEGGGLESWMRNSGRGRETTDGNILTEFHRPHQGGEDESYKRGKKSLAKGETSGSQGS